MTKKELNERIADVKEIRDDENNITDIAGFLQIAENDKLAQSVFKQLGGNNNIETMLETLTNLKDIANNGIDNGFYGFIYRDERGNLEDWRYSDLKNALAWYAGEKIAREYNDLVYDKSNIDKKFIEQAETKLKNYATKEIQRLKNEFTKSNSIGMNM